MMMFIPEQTVVLQVSVFLVSLPQKNQKNIKKPPNIHKKINIYSDFINLIFFSKSNSFYSQLCLGIQCILQKVMSKLIRHSTGWRTRASQSFDLL